MPHTTGFLVDRLLGTINEALDLTTRAEKSAEFVYTSRLHIYETSYLLAFCAWENFLEEVFLRLLCGYHNGKGRATLLAGKTYSVDLTAARVVLFSGRDYLLWHSPQYAIRRSQRWFDNSGPAANAPLEAVPASSQSDLEDFAAIRHFIAHRTSDARAKFDTAARRQSGYGVLGSRAGRFLRQDTTDPTTGIRMSWMARICDDLVSLANQIAA